MLFGTGTSFSLARKAAMPEIAFTVMYPVIARAPLRCSGSQYLRITCMVKRRLPQTTFDLHTLIILKH
jgi:hypothetical protein